MKLGTLRRRASDLKLVYKLQTSGVVSWLHHATSRTLPNNCTKLTLTLPIGVMGFDYEPKFNDDASGETTGAQFSR